MHLQASEAKCRPCEKCILCNKCQCLENFVYDVTAETNNLKLRSVVWKLIVKEQKKHTI